MHTIIRPLCNSLDKTFYDVTFARGFWRGKQMSVTASSDTGLRRIRCCTVLHRSKVKVRAFFYL